MEITASAPGKAILFGEHAVVYGKPAIAVAVNRRAQINILERNDTRIHVRVPGLNVSGYLDIEKEVIKITNHDKKKNHDKNSINSSQNQSKTDIKSAQSPNNTGILKYILKSLKKIQNSELIKSEFNKGLDILLDLEMPIGAGLGSSAAVTVATLAALQSFYQLEFGRDKIASYAHQVELEVQGAASPIDTTLSTYGGAIHLSRNAGKVEDLPLNWDIPLIIGHIKRENNTGELIQAVRIKKERYPLIINPILESIEEVTESARQSLIEKDEERLGELMNMNHGLLDALGVNTPALSRMVYLARSAGSMGSKITGAGGGGSIIAFCPGKMDEVLFKLQQVTNAFPVKISNNGVQVKSKEV